MVAVICGPHMKGGTGFRVGRSYLITAAHVIKSIVGDEPLSDGKKTYDSSELSQEVHAMFNYYRTAEECKKFYFDKRFWMDKELDVAILRFNKAALEDMAFPRNHLDKSCSFAKLDLSQSQRKVVLIAHQGNDPKSVCLNGKIYSPDFAKLGSPYEEAKKMADSRIYYTGTMQHGSSGAPVFLSGKLLELVAVHVGGYPHPEAKPNTGSPGGKKEQQHPEFLAGTSMHALKNAIQGSSPELEGELFSDSKSPE